MNLIGRDVRFDFQDAVNVHSGHSKTGRDSGKEERTETRNVNLKPGSLTGRSRSGSGGHKGFPRSLETSSEVSGKRKRTARILQTGNITFVIAQAFYPVLLTVSRKVSISFHSCECCGLVAGLYLFTRYALPLDVLSTPFGSDYHARVGLGFPLNSAIYRRHIRSTVSTPCRRGRSLQGSPAPG